MDNSLQAVPVLHSQAVKPADEREWQNTVNKRFVKMS